MYRVVSVMILDGLGIGAGSGHPDGERAHGYNTSTSRLHCTAVGNSAEAVFSLLFFPFFFFRPPPPQLPRYPSPKKHGRYDIRNRAE